MHFDPQQIIIGMAMGSVYASLGLALVLIFRSTGVVNFAQGEMATFFAYISWTLIVAAGIPYWVGIGIAIALSFLLGLGAESAVIRRLAQHSELAVVIGTLGLFLFFNGLDLSIWQGVPKDFPAPFGRGVLRLGTLFVSVQHVGVLGVSLVFMLIIYIFFRFTKIGLALEASTLNPTAARLMGIDVDRMLMLGWGLASVLGSVAGILTADLLLLEPNMMAGTILFSFAAIALGGVTSAVGAVVGGILVGVLQSAVGTAILGGTSLRTPLAFLVIVLVLAFRPNGLFGRVTVTRA